MTMFKLYIHCKKGTENTMVSKYTLYINASNTDLNRMIFLNQVVIHRCYTIFSALKTTAVQTV